MTHLADETRFRVGGTATPNRQVFPMRLSATLSLYAVLALSSPPLLSAQNPAPVTEDNAVVAAARTAVESWLQLLDSGLYAESWDSASTAFRKLVSKPDWEKAVTGARAPFEPFKSRAPMMARVEHNLPGAPPGEYVIFQYHATVAEARTVVETVVPMKDTDGAWRVSGYFVRPQ
jgi:hypothetical protein